ncbi:hypothetical protein G7Y41_08770 [Schaalia sp. ZJ405]|uniref:hypothetical protein n=1 Tax=Schaalia sp. ZJ405 TaxID=2709403 RepID=UPI0013EA5759|nr:hypothetical protein [Schaalia sp. ZJ405]QPK81117.1 hypothetical protein G7Y41_08770 [Schaalia sp. ZJ405]
MSHVRFEWRGNQASAATQEAAARGLRLAAEHLRGVSQQAAPIREGILRASATVTMSMDQTTAAVSYDTPYAVEQHEELGYRHPKGGQAKYLEGPARDEKNTMTQIIQAHLKRIGGA